MGIEGCFRSVLCLIHYLVHLPNYKMFLTVVKKLFNEFHHGVLTIRCPSLPSFARDDRKSFQYLNIVFNNKSGTLSVANPELQIRGGAVIQTLR